MVSEGDPPPQPASKARAAQTLTAWRRRNDIRIASKPTLSEALKRFGIEDAPSAHRLDKNAQSKTQQRLPGCTEGWTLPKKLTAGSQG